MLAMLLPSSSAPIMRSRTLSSQLTFAAWRLPCFSSRNILARDEPVSAVSLAAKNAEISSRTMTMRNESQCIVLASAQLALQEGVDGRRLDVRRDHGLTQRLQQNERQAPAPDLLVLRHQRHQRIRVTDAFLRESGDILQSGRQADGCKMRADARRIALSNHAKLGGQLGREHHADRDTLAVQQAIGEARCRFERVAEGVAEIE